MDMTFNMLLFDLYDNALILLFICLVAYLMGSINFSIIISKFINNKDIREYGSGNAGATNMLRNYGKKAAIFTALGDILKSVIVVIAATFLAKSIEANYTFLFSKIVEYLAGLFCVIGHLYPVWFGFKGGKGVATAWGISLVIDWRIAIVGIVVFLLIAILSRYVSLASMIAGTSMVVFTFVFAVLDGDYPSVLAPYTETIMFGLTILLVILKHIPNIKRLINGTENKVHWRKAAK